MSSRVPARERMVAVRCKRTEPGGGERKDRDKLAAAAKRAIARAFGTTTKPSEIVMLLTEAFPIRGTSPASRGLLRPRVRHRDAHSERSEKLADRAKC